ncbi:MAG: hypothetical protein EON92_10045 [Burkholderiales bacterium]|nr:MAG: hypothetical protein EON92_10045 [Burkholderiales bacterium]
MKTLHQLYAAMLLAVASCAPAFAQGQSPASGHGFFLAVLQAHPVLLTDFSMTAPQTRDVTAAESEGCISRLTSVVASAPPVETVLDWKAIRITRVENESDLRLRGRGIDVMLGFETREVAQRVARALTAVRRDCDPVAGFGF